LANFVLYEQYELFVQKIKVSVGSSVPAAVNLVAEFAGARVPNVHKPLP